MMSHLHSTLKAQTREKHQQLEQNPLISQLLSPQLDLKTYSQILTQYHAFYTCYEPMIDRFITDYPYDAKIDLLRHDLEQTGYPVEEHYATYDIVDTRDKALGALYVIEGASLGGQIILRSLKKQLPHLDHRFFKGYGRHTGQQWQMFLRYLTKIESTIEKNSVVDAANATFSAFDLCMRT